MLFGLRLRQVAGEPLIKCNFNCYFNYNFEGVNWIGIYNIIVHFYVSANEIIWLFISDIYSIKKTIASKLILFWVIILNGYSITFLFIYIFTHIWFNLFQFNRKKANNNFSSPARKSKINISLDMLFSLFFSRLLIF